MFIVKHNSEWGIFDTISQNEGGLYITGQNDSMLDGISKNYANFIV